MHRSSTWFALFIAGACAIGCSPQPPSQPANPTPGAQAGTVGKQPAAPNAEKPATESSLASAAQTPADNWVAITSLDGRLSARMPSEPKTEEKTVNSKTGPIQVRSQKVLSPGIVWNVLVRTFSPEMFAAETDKAAALEKLAEINEKQKTDVERVYLKRIDDAKYPTIEHRFRYRFGKNPKTGEPLSWFSIARHSLVGTSVCTAFIGVQDAVYQGDPSKFDKDISRFFESVQIRDE